MKITPLHEWNLSPQAAVELQKQFAHEVITEDKFDAPIKRVAGIDLGYDLKTDTSRAVVVVLKFPELELIESAEAIMPIQFPYVPGLLSFRETPVAVKALEKLENAPDLILCDGQGIAHPRRFGIACHIGLLTGVPSVGVALRTKDKVQPLYVSVGHLISLETAISYVLQCTPKYRLPETTRLADRLASFRKR